MYTTHNIFPVLPIKQFFNKDGEPTMPHKLATGVKPSVLTIRVFSCVLKKATAHVEVKALNMRRQPKKGFWGIFLGISQHQKMVPHIHTYYTKDSFFT